MRDCRVFTSSRCCLCAVMLPPAGPILYFFFSIFSQRGASLGARDEHRRCPGMPAWHPRLHSLQGRINGAQNAPGGDSIPGPAGPRGAGGTERDELS